MILRLNHIGIAVESLDNAITTYSNLFGYIASDIRNDQEHGAQLDARIMMPNQTWLHLVENHDANSLTNKFLQEHGEGLDHAALETDDIELEIAHLKALGVNIYQNKVFESSEGKHAYILAKDAIGFNVELIQPSKRALRWNPDKISNPNLKGLQHIGVAVTNVKESTAKFRDLFRIEARGLRTDQHYGTQLDMMIEPGNDRLWFHLVESTDPENRVTQFMAKHGEGLEHLCIEVDDIRRAVKTVKKAGVPLFMHKIFLDRDDGFEAFVYPEYNHGVTVELIEPYITSRGYRYKVEDF